MLLKTFGWSFAVTALGLVAAAFYGGWTAFGIVAILAVLEISLSFDNAVVNAGILKKMNAFWQKIFLTVGVLIAVFGMRLVFPVVIVAISAKMGPVEAVDLALNNKDRYQQLVTDAHPAIAAFGGMFLLMIFLDFIFEDRDIQWLRWIERPLAKLGKVDMLSVCIALVVLLITSFTFATHAHQHGGAHVDKAQTVLIAGIAGLITYMVVGGLSGYFEDKLEQEEEREHEEEEEAARTGKRKPAIVLAGQAAFFMFLYLEVLDASFSFDGVIGAFAITNDIVLMALGLGIGAMYVRSLTVYLVRQGTLDDYVYLEHGAHYAIGALAVILMVTIQHEINEVVTGLVGVVLIAASFLSSVRRNRALAAAEGNAVGSGEKAEASSEV
ncbi:integral membrane protein [Streptomyces hygroscopicus subsp. jinggangensis 5008]|nr:integral membrane protein [Streptomyces hygroscopicus subsp. jinggangensis 5008]AGF68147.1 integral membrane protein [Streptomyces hygroscopicus subsp. jinggangensis TL01]